MEAFLTVKGRMEIRAKKQLCHCQTNFCRRFEVTIPNGMNCNNISRRPCLVNSAYRFHKQKGI